MADTFIDIHSSVHTIRSGVFPWNVSFGHEFVDRTKGSKANTVIDLCAGTGHLGITVAEAIGAKKVILIESDPITCKIAKDIWRNYEAEGILVINADILRPPLAYSAQSLVVSNPPHAPLPNSFRSWRNVYGGEDGLLFVRAIFHWLLNCEGPTLFFVSTYLVSQKVEVSKKDILEALNMEDPGVKNIYHFQEPMWRWRNVEENNPGCSERVFAWYLDYCQHKEKERFLKFKKNHPYTHHILIEGERK
ncbi:MAG: class I SAM-dependent methyltransferase [Desulfobacterales bacterium]|nr:class I SAM-dependent methyltransferase [Desulfobacterales bacterium]